MSSIHILSPNDFSMFFPGTSFLTRAVGCFLTHQKWQSWNPQRWAHKKKFHFFQAHRRAIQAAAPGDGDLAALGLKLWICRLLTRKGKPFIETYAILWVAGDLEEIIDK